MKYTVIGGTGTLGRELVRQLLSSHPAGPEITVFSRDEQKQQAMAREFPSVRYLVGDVRDRRSVENAVRGAHTVFHTAAMKHIDVVERNPVEAFKTNVLGTVNVAEACDAMGVRNMVFSSTDKAVDPVNVYGHTKALGERYLLGLNKDSPSLLSTKFVVYRWGNVLGSRGSAVHVFQEALRERRRIPITHLEMTRFWIQIRDAVRFMLDTHGTAPTHKVMIPPMNAASVVEVAKAVAYTLGISDFDYECVGIRPGEKIHEAIEPGVTSDSVPHYTPRELADMVQEVVDGR